MNSPACQTCAARKRIALELWPKRRPLYVMCDPCKEVAREYRSQVIQRIILGLLGAGGAVAMAAAFLLAAYGVAMRIAHHWGGR